MLLMAKNKEKRKKKIKNKVPFYNTQLSHIYSNWGNCHTIAFLNIVFAQKTQKNAGKWVSCLCDWNEGIEFITVNSPVCKIELCCGY